MKTIETGIAEANGAPQRYQRYREGVVLYVCAGEAVEKVVAACRAQHWVTNGGVSCFVTSSIVRIAVAQVHLDNKPNGDLVLSNNVTGPFSFPKPVAAKIVRAVTITRNRKSAKCPTEMKTWQNGAFDVDGTPKANFTLGRVLFL